MRIRSVKFNFIMNAILTVAGIIFPLITFPYISRVLLVEGNGKISFAMSVATYFSMFASLGIPTYGIRACAKVRDNKDELSKTVQELLIINLITTVIAYIVFFVSLMLIPEFAERKEILLIMSVSIGLTSLGVSWLYSALEQYSYITMCSIVFKILGIVLMFLFVKTPEDYLAYGVIYVIGTFGSNVLNFIRLRRFISFRKIGHYNFRRHIRAVLVFFAMSVATNIYANLDVVMLGFMQDDMAVGYYNSAVKVKTVLVTCVTSLGTVLLPRMSYYIENNDKEAFQRMAVKAFRFVVIVASSVTVYFVIMAKESILLLSGEAFLPSVAPMIILMPTVFVIGVSNITGIQMLTPMDQEKKVMYSVVAGAVLDFILNMWLIPKYSYSGAAFATLMAELLVLVIQCVYLRGILKDIYSYLEVWKIGVALVLATIGTLAVRVLDLPVFLSLVVTAMVFFGIFGGVLLAVKEAFVWEIVSSVLNRGMRK